MSSRIVFPIKSPTDTNLGQPTATMSKLQAVSDKASNVSDPQFPSVTYSNDPFDIATVMMTYHNGQKMYFVDGDWSSIWGGRLAKFLGYAYVPKQTEIQNYLQNLRRVNKNPTYEAFEASIESFEYLNSTPVIVPSIISASTYRNGSTAQAQEQFFDTKTTTAVASWSLTNALSEANGLTNAISYGSSSTFSHTSSNSSSVKAGFNFKVFSLGGDENNAQTSSNSSTASSSTSESSTLSTTISLTQAKTESISQTQTWTWNTTIAVPPKSIVTAAVAVRDAAVATAFKGKLKFKGVLWFETPEGNHVGVDTLSWFNLHSIVVTSLYVPEIIVPGPFFIKYDQDQPYVLYELKGNFSGHMGVYFDVTVNQTGF